MKKKVLSVVGARPNFIKIAPIDKVFKNLYINEIDHYICHTGQHFDEKMSKVFFDELEIPRPDFYLGVGGGSHAEQTARIMVEFEKILLQIKPDLVLVPGDVNSTLAASVTAVKLHIKVGHVEAGLRSGDMRMPEEVNRILTDKVSSLLFVTEKSGIDNLKAEGTSDDKVYFAGNVMIDSLINYLPKINNSKAYERFSLKANNYVLATFHRPSNVDNKNALKRLIDSINVLANEIKVIFPIHPRTKNNLVKYGYDKYLSPNIILTEPLGYIKFLSLINNASLVITDSGGIQEETTFLGIQCVTLRENTERPVTCDIGTNHLAGTDYFYAVDRAIDLLNGKGIKNGRVPEFWDGKASERIAKIILNKLQK